MFYLSVYFFRVPLLATAVQEELETGVAPSGDACDINCTVRTLSLFTYSAFSRRFIQFDKHGSYK